MFYIIPASVRLMRNMFRLQSKEEAQNAPTPVTTYALFYNGAYLTNEQMNDRKFLKLLSK